MSLKINSFTVKVEVVERLLVTSILSEAKACWKDRGSSITALPFSVVSTAVE